ncbi:MAG: hypothetical protein ACOYN0_16040 [Phycisphaerales bacterium]
MPLRALVGFAALLALLTGCQPAPHAELDVPRAIVSPYDGSKGEVLWVVATLRNESGVSLFEPTDVTDKLIKAAEEIRGVRTVPQNRTLQAMTALGLKGLQTPADARKLAEALGADAILVGTITAYDPYTPTLGLSLGLYARPGAMMPKTAPGVDSRELATAPTDRGLAARSPNAPLSMVSCILDGKNHQVQMDLKRFATGRSAGESALGWRRYMSSMDLYSEFGAYSALSELMQIEWLRLQGEAPVAELAKNDR